MKRIVLDLKDISEIREIMESRESPGIRYFIYILSLLILLSVLFSCFFEIDEYTRIPGEIKTYSASSQVISGTTCKLSHVSVTEGQQVKKGDTLFVIDSDYSAEQKKIIDKKIEDCSSELQNTEKLKESVIQGKNLFDNTDYDEDYYYRYEQYVNSARLSESEISRSQKTDEVSEIEKEASLKNAQDSLSQKKQLLAEYICVRECIEYDYEYAGNSPVSISLISDFRNQYQKSCLNADQLKTAYENIRCLYENSQNNTSESEDNEMNEENPVTASDVDNAKFAYENALVDSENVKNSYISDINVKIESLNAEIKSLENNRNALEKAAESGNDFDEYKEAVMEKLKNETIISLNSEIDSLNEKLDTYRSQLLEINETIKNTEIKAEFNGTVTLVSDLNQGDIIQGGQSLCTLLPDDDRLKANLFIPENEISKICPGQKTEYVFDALPYNEYGKITGEIVSVSADSIVNEQTGMKYYIAQADLSAFCLENSKGDKREIKNGMLTEAKVISGSEKVIHWLLRKINLTD